MEFIDNVNGKRVIVEGGKVTTQDAVDFLQRRKGIDEIKKKILEPETGFELVTFSLQERCSTN